MNHVQPLGFSFLRLVIAASIMLWSGCSLPMPLQSEFLGSIGWRKPAAHLDGVVVAAMHESKSPIAAEYAMALSAATGAGLVIDRGPGPNPFTAVSFSSRSIPIVAPTGNLPPNDPRPSFKSVLRSVAAGPIEFFVGVETANRSAINVTATGLTSEQIAALKASYLRIGARESIYYAVPFVEVTVQTVDELPWRERDIQRRSLMALVARGLDIRLPERLSAGPIKQAYKKILSLWIAEAIELVQRNPSRLPTMKVAVLEYGKIESIPGDPKARLVIGAPHGTFDPYTAGVAGQICARGGFPGVIARGFTPAETGSWRINVNRPTERHIATGEQEIETPRARRAYRQFTASVLAAVGGDLDFYVDIHQNTGQRIEVVTVGISRDVARAIKKTFLALRDAALAERMEIASVDFAIEPIDDLEVGAWAARTNGILTLAKQSLHFELPSHGLMSSARQRNFYTPILAELVVKMIPHLRVGR